MGCLHCLRADLARRGESVSPAGADSRDVQGSAQQVPPELAFLSSHPVPPAPRSLSEATGYPALLLKLL